MLRKILVSVVMFSFIFIMFSPLVFALPSVVENTDGYGGAVDYAPQTSMNRKGDLIAVYGRGEGESSDRMMARYSKDGGNTWSSRVILFSTSAQGDGIIDDDVASQWEFDVRIFDDVLYLAMHLKYPDYSPVQRVGFTKIDISDVANIENYANWKSADGTSAPSEGNGDDGQGYDILGGNDGLSPDADPVIEVLFDGTIVYGYTTEGNASIQTFDGSVWSSPTIIYSNSDMSSYVILSLCTDSQDNLHLGMHIRPSASSWYIIYKGVSVGDDPLVATNWRNLSGDAPTDTYNSFDFIIDLGTADAKFPHCTTTADDYFICTVATEVYNSFRRIYYNWHDGSTWQESTTQDSAGVEVETGNLDVHSNARKHGIMADGAGNVYVIYMERTTHDIRNITWDKTSHTFGAWTLVEDLDATVYANIVSAKYVPGFTTKGMFLATNYTVGTDENLTYNEITVETGDPWWDREPEEPPPPPIPNNPITFYGIGADFTYFGHANVLTFKSKIQPYREYTTTWYYGDGTISNEDEEHLYEDSIIPKKYEVRLQVCDRHSCVNETKMLTVIGWSGILLWSAVAFVSISLIIAVTIRSHKKKPKYEHWWYGA